MGNNLPGEFSFHNFTGYNIKSTSVRYFTRNGRSVLTSDEQLFSMKRTLLEHLDSSMYFGGVRVDHHFLCCIFCFV
jgi:hypothetical protein